MATLSPEFEALQERIRLAPGALIGARLRRARKTAGGDGISHDKLAGAVGTSRQHLIKLEQAKHRPGAELLLRIAEATGHSVDWFLDPEVDPSPFPDEAELVDGTGRHADRGAPGLQVSAAVTQKLRQEAGTS